MITPRRCRGNVPARSSRASSRKSLPCISPSEAIIHEQVFKNFGRERADFPLRTSVPEAFSWVVGMVTPHLYADTVRRGIVVTVVHDNLDAPDLGQRLLGVLDHAVHVLLKAEFRDARRRLGFHGDRN